MTYIVSTQKVDDLTVEVVLDENPWSPRDDDNLGTMLCCYRGYTLGDTQFKPGLYASHEELLEGHGYDPKHDIWFPLSVYDHSGLSMYITGTGGYRQHESWDSSMVGVIVVSRAKVRNDFACKRVTKDVREHAEHILRSEVDTYNKYLTGQVYGYVVKDADNEVMDACYGYYEENDALEEGVGYAEWYCRDRVKRHGDKVKAWIRSHVPLIYRTSVI